MIPFVVWVVVVGRKINMNQPMTIMGNYSATKIVGMSLVVGKKIVTTFIQRRGRKPTDDALRYVESPTRGNGY